MDNEQASNSPLRIQDSTIGKRSQSLKISHLGMEKSPSSIQHEDRNVSVPLGCQPTMSTRSKQRGRSPSPCYRYVEPHTRHRSQSTAQDDEKQSLQIKRPTRSSIEDELHESISWFGKNNHNISASLDHDGININSYPRTGSFRPRDTRRRRKRERPYSDNKHIPPWEQSHVIDTQDRSRPVFINERFVYQPRNTKANEESRRQHLYVDSKEASQYYVDDWAGREPAQSVENNVQRKAANRGRYRQDVYPDIELADSEDTHDGDFCMHSRRLRL